MSGTYDADGVDTMEPAALPSGMLGSDEFIETNASTLLHTFKDEAEIYREFNPQVFVGLNDVEPSQDGTLVIGRTASDELAVIGNVQSERIGVPPVALESLDSKGSASFLRNLFDNHNTHGLDVKVTVNKDRLLLWILTDLPQNHRRKLGFVPVEGFGAEIF